MVIYKTLQQVGFTSRAEPVLWCFTERRFEGKEHQAETPEDTAIQPRSHKFGTLVTTFLHFKNGFRG